jgi:hypothetical protein
MTLIADPQVTTYLCYTVEYCLKLTCDAFSASLLLICQNP